jgi:penicillin-binding protein 1A
MRRVLSCIMWPALTTVCGVVLTLTGVFLYLNPQIPSAESYRHLRLETPLRVFTADGQLIAEFGQRRLIPMPIDAMPELFLTAVLDTEDKRFYDHGGIDLITLMNAGFELVRNRGQIRGPGGSTITMQLARNISFTLERTFIRKFKEILLALKIERELDKDEILELYLNVIPFGKGAYGAEAAARTYYGRGLSELNLSQLAMLAGIPQAPTAGNPINGPERALKRRNLVLARMLEQDHIDQGEYDIAVAAPITAQRHGRTTELPAPYAAEWARQELLERYGSRIYTDGFEAYTTIVPRMQSAASAAVARGVLGYDERHGYRGPEDRLATDLAELAETGSDFPSIEAYWLSTLAGVVPYRHELPAVVTAVNERSFNALITSGETLEIPWEGMAWARPYIDANTLGRRPQHASDVVAAGDVIRLREDPSTGWRLSQLPQVQSALVALDPEDGAVRALVGGYDFNFQQFNHATQARRQPGSGFKPFVYAAALDHGLTPASMFTDAPLVFDDANLEGYYRPGNSGGTFQGPTRLRTALYRSINLVSMRVLLEVGAENVVSYVGRFGFDTREFPLNTQLAVGGGTIAVTPLEMARAFAVFANGGYLVDPYLVESVRRDNGEVLYVANPRRVCRDCPEPILGLEGMAPMQPPSAADEELTPEDMAAIEGGSGKELAGDDLQSEDLLTEDLRSEDLQSEGLQSEDVADEPMGSEGILLADQPRAERVIDARTAYIMNSMLRDVVQRGTGSRARQLGRRDLAGKTGTTNEADTWFNGFSQNLVATVWLGFSDSSPLGDNEFGANGPLPIWIDFMREALDGEPERLPPRPDGLVSVRIDPKTGQLAQPGDRGAVFEIFRKENAPRMAASTQTPTNPYEDEQEVRPEDIF